MRQDYPAEFKHNNKGGKETNKEWCDNIYKMQQFLYTKPKEVIFILTSASAMDLQYLKAKDAE